MTGADVVNAARKDIGVKFQHQGRLRGVALDCAGLVLGVMDELGIEHEDITQYGRQPDAQRFRAYVRTYCDAVQFRDLHVGDLLTFRYADEQHLGIVSVVDPLTIIHATEKTGRVDEVTLDSVWLNRLRGCYRFKALQE
jgi:cell wall-associated NlpC family hydrolase